MKRVNITRDVVSRQNIAAASTRTEPIVEPVKTEETDAQSEELQGGENDPKHDQTLPTTSKRGRKTQGDV